MRRRGRPPARASHAGCRARGRHHSGRAPGHVRARRGPPRCGRPSGSPARSRTRGRALSAPVPFALRASRRSSPGPRRATDARSPAPQRRENVGPDAHAADRQLRLLHIQPLPSPGRGQRHRAGGRAQRRAPVGGTRRSGGRQRGDLAWPWPAGAPARRRCLAGCAVARRDAGARRLPRSPGPRPRGGRYGRACARGHARAPEPDPPRCERALRRDPAGLPRRALPLARGRLGARGAAGHRLDARRGDQGTRAPDAPAVRRAVPSRVGEHPARPPPARELPRGHPRPGRAGHGPSPPSAARGGARRGPRAPRGAPSPPPAGGPVRARSGRRPRRRPAAGRDACPAPVGARIHHRRLESWCEPEAVFRALYAERDHAIWLDSASQGMGVARFSFIGTPDGALGQVVRYDVDTRTLVVDRASGREVRTVGVLDYCRDELARLRTDAPELPFDFTCGFAGYLGYELKAECGGRPAYASPLPDAALVLCDRLIAFDHRERRVYLLALADEGGAAAAAAWLATTARRLGEIAREPPPLPSPPAPPGTLRFELREAPEAYRANIAACLREIVEGETYEVCLTTELRGAAGLDPVAAYCALRARNPAPFAALLRLGDLSVLSSSPERFLRVDRRRVVESRPMKGTAARVAEPFEDACRAAELRRDQKTRAENLMIADLVRNDLGRVCALGSVEVPGLMIVESYATVHQMVTVVRGRLREGSDAIDCVRAAFPPGSMTGAPKLRTLEIIDRIERRPRGIYAGALGFLAVNGAADLSVVIRTLVASPDGLMLGAGGAIVAASDPDAELEEMLLKTRPVLETIGGTLDVGRDVGAAHR